MINFCSHNYDRLLDSNYLSIHSYSEFFIAPCTPVVRYCQCYTLVSNHTSFVLCLYLFPTALQFIGLRYGLVTVIIFSLLTIIVLLTQRFFSSYSLQCCAHCTLHSHMLRYFVVNTRDQFPCPKRGMQNIMFQIFLLDVNILCFSHLYLYISF